MNNELKTPDFIIVGAQKCGTTTLHFALKKHPNIFMATTRYDNELNFFQNDKRYERGIKWYASFFKDCPIGHMAGESSPEYFHYDGVARRIANTLPSVKIIILLRNPVDRAYSGYWHAVRLAGETLSFESAIEIESNRIAKAPCAMKYYSYVSRGHYIKAIGQYFENFNKSNILVIIAEEYFSKAQLILTQVTDFLGVHCDQEFLNNASKVVANEARLPRSIKLQRYYPYLSKRFTFFARAFHKLNTKKVKYPPLSLKTRKRLLKHFASSNLMLEDLLGLDLSIWNDDYK